MLRRRRVRSAERGVDLAAAGRSSSEGGSDSQPGGCPDRVSRHQHPRTPQVALEMLLYELRGALVVGFSVVEVLFADGLINSPPSVETRCWLCGCSPGWPTALACGARCWCFLAAPTVVPARR